MKEAETTLKINEKMVNGSTIESFAICVFCFFCKTSGRRTRHSCGKVRGEDTEAVIFRGSG